MTTTITIDTKKTPVKQVLEGLLDIVGCKQYDAVPFFNMTGAGILGIPEEGRNAHTIYYVLAREEGEKIPYNTPLENRTANHYEITSFVGDIPMDKEAAIRNLFSVH